MSRTAKQITILFIFLIIIAVIGGGIYLLIKGKLPTCSDGIQNQGEASVDCGGPCDPCSWQLRKDIEIIFTKAIKTRNNYVDLVAQMKNPNQDFGAKSFSYSFNIYDSEGEIINSRQGDSYILPLETRYVIEQKISADRIISKVEFKLNDVAWEELVSDYKEPELLVRNSNFKQGDDISVFSATLENRSNYDLNKVDIRVVLFDRNSEILGVGKTELQTILSKSDHYFEVNWFFPFESQIADMNIAAKTNVFLDENFMRQFGSDREKFQEY